MTTTFPFTFPGTFGDGAPPPDPLDRTPSPATSDPLPGIVTDLQNVVIRDIKGTQLYQFLANNQVDMSWSRELRQTSKCMMTLPPLLTDGSIPNIVPWLHWVDVWDQTGANLMWSGPILDFKGTKQQSVIEASDLSAYFSRTRVPMTKSWDATDPASIAFELWRAMMDWHGLPGNPIVSNDPLGQNYDFSVTADNGQLDQVMDDLVRLGLFWCVANNTVLLGPRSLKPVAVLGENDFVGAGMGIHRDGTNSYNDILVRAPDDIARAVVPMGGLRLQQTVDIDSMFAVGNADRAAYQYARYQGSVRDQLILPDNAVLHPNAPVSIDQLIPSARFSISAFGEQFLMQLTSVNVNFSQGTTAVSVQMEAVDDDQPELITIQQNDSLTGLGSQGGVGSVTTAGAGTISGDDSTS